MEYSGYAKLERLRSAAGDDLRKKILEAAGDLFGRAGYENVSARNIAQAAGCSQMAMYRHFPDKDSLLRHLCTELYERFTIQMHRKYDKLRDPRERLRRSMRDFLLLSLKNPHHYRLTFLTPSKSDKGLIHEEVASASISYFRDNLRLCFRSGTPERLIEQRMQQLFAVQHGITVMLITRPKAYGLTKESALHALDAAFTLFVSG